MRFHYSFLGIIGNEPFGKYKDPDHHHLHQKIISVISEKNNSMETFRKWQNEVISGFNQNIWLAVDVSNLAMVIKKYYVDSLCVVRLID